MAVCWWQNLFKMASRLYQLTWLQFGNRASLLAYLAVFWWKNLSKLAGRFYCLTTFYSGGRTNQSFPPVLYMAQCWLQNWSEMDAQLFWLVLLYSLGITYLKWPPGSISWPVSILVAEPAQNGHQALFGGLALLLWQNLSYKQSAVP